MKYFDIFNSIDSVHENWPGSKYVKDKEVLFAIYSYEYYEGAAYLLFQRDGKLFEVYDNHCSCNGLENWEPEETSWAALKKADKTNYGIDFNDFFQNLVQAEGQS
jgi:hypothetical protein